MPVKIICDASQSGIGAALILEGEPIYFIRHAQMKQEMLKFKKEVLAIVLAVVTLRQYIFWESVTEATDHSPLVTIMKKNISQVLASVQKLFLEDQG